MTLAPPLPAYFPPNRSEWGLQPINDFEVECRRRAQRSWCIHSRSDQDRDPETIRDGQHTTLRLHEEYGDQDQDDVIPHDTPEHTPFQNEQRIDSPI
jgi:hypothetical protein